MKSSKDDDEKNTQPDENEKDPLTGQNVSDGLENFEINAADILEFLKDNEEAESTDGGVRFIGEKDPTQIRLEQSEINGVTCAKIFIVGLVYKDNLSNKEKLASKPQGNYFEVERLLARVRPDLLETFPVNARYYKLNYLRPKYGNLEKISLINYEKPWKLPQTEKEFELLLSKFPEGFGKRALYGLGARKQYLGIFQAISSIPKVKELIITTDEETKVQGSTYRLGYYSFENLRSAVDSIVNRSRRESYIDRSILIHNELRNKADPTAFPKEFRRPKPGALYELVNLGAAAQSKRSKADRKAAMQVVKSDVELIAKSDPDQLLSLKESIELATLGNIILKFEKMLPIDSKEKTWQTFLSENSFILRLAFSYPVFYIGKEQHIGISDANGKGAKITDFLFSQHLTGGLAILEIKTPECKILGAPYRGKPKDNNVTYSIHPQLSGAVVQILDQRSRLQTEFIAIANKSKWTGYHSNSVQCILIAGRDPITDDEKKSFDLFRQSNKDVVIITFTELLNKLKGLHAVIKSWSDAKEESLAGGKT